MPLPVPPVEQVRSVLDFKADLRKIVTYFSLHRSNNKNNNKNNKNS